MAFKSAKQRGAFFEKQKEKGGIQGNLLTAPKLPSTLSVTSQPSMPKPALTSIQGLPHMPQPSQSLTPSWTKFPKLKNKIKI